MDMAEVALLLVAAAGAGWIDAVVGGGGLLQLPALFLAGVPSVQALATNKLASVFGTASAAVTYAVTTKIDKRVAIPAGLAALASAGLGASAAAAISRDALIPLVMAALVVVALFVTLRPAFGVHPEPHLGTRARTLAAIAVTGVAIAFYDGILGPGTGTFLIIAFTTLLGMDFVGGSAHSKIINSCTNLGALLVFAYQGHVLWLLGLGMAACNVAGAQLGARMALRKGAKFVRIVLLCVVIAMVAKLGIDQTGS
ncbi:TSUP family transporter [Planomonospora sp. ID67723]|uniref:TSUP family transporter n=1 Tax=Planomonospora sp. ID67723 TaxID=2738134 RepID=UPI0018C3F8A3|nr:TSUP family transporter [Planomonospora sp. ID67723]MBG0831774.1 TSUP family transporter [Planomonospora sp. ID67723]